MKKEIYSEPSVTVVTVHIEKALLQASAQGFTSDGDFDNRFFGLE